MMFIMLQVAHWQELFLLRDHVSTDWSCLGPVKVPVKSCSRFLQWRQAPMTPGPMKLAWRSCSEKATKMLASPLHLSAEPDPNGSKHVCRCESIPTHAATLSLPSLKWSSPLSSISCCPRMDAIRWPYLILPFPPLPLHPERLPSPAYRTPPRCCQEELTRNADSISVHQSSQNPKSTFKWSRKDLKAFQAFLGIDYLENQKLWQV